MSHTLHVFKLYKIEADITENYEIYYEDDKDYDIASGNWLYIYTILQYAKYLTKIELSIPIYDCFDDADGVHDNGMILTDSSLFIKGLEAVINNINKINENPLIGDNDWYLYDTNEAAHGTFDNQKQQIVFYTKKLLEWAKQGLHFVEERW